MRLEKVGYRKCFCKCVCFLWLEGAECEAMT